MDPLRKVTFDADSMILFIFTFYKSLINKFSVSISQFNSISVFAAASSLKKLISCLLLLTLTALSAQPDLSQYRTNEPHPKVYTVPSAINQLKRTPERFFPALADFLLEGLTDPYEKVKLLHDWVALNLEYDIKGLQRGNIPAQTTKNVLSSGKAVCGGFAAVFTELCEAAQIPVREINGHARGFGFDISQKERFESNHAWNAVQIEGVWYLIDATWDGGYGTPDYRYIKEYSTAFLFLEPQWFIHTHFPEKAADQLLASPISFKEFSHLPYYRGEMFQAGIYPLEKYSRHLTVQNGIFKMRFENRKGAEIIAVILDKRGEEFTGQALVEYMNDETELTIHFPQKGNTRLSIYAREAGAKGEYNNFAEFQVDVKASSPLKPMEKYQGYDAARFEVLHPIWQPLKHGETVTFRFQNNGMKKMMLLFDDAEKIWLDIPVQNGIWEYPLLIKGKKSLAIYIESGLGDNRYGGIVKYAIQ
jgi:hypothetical protein